MTLLSSALFLLAISCLLQPEPSFAEFTEDSLTIEVSKSGQVRVIEEITPRTTVSRISINTISNNVSSVLAVDENYVVLSSTYSGGIVKIDTLGSSHVTLTYFAAISNEVAPEIWDLSYSSHNIQSTIVLPPMSDITYVNEIPIDISGSIVTMPAGEIVLRYKIRSVSTHNLVASWEDKQYTVQVVTASRIQEFIFEQSSRSITLNLDTSAPMLVIVPKSLLGGPYSVITTDARAPDFRQYYQNSTHSWIRIEPIEGDTSIKIIGSSVVPEFGLLSLSLPLGMAITGILLFIAKKLTALTKKMPLT